MNLNFLFKSFDHIRYENGRHVSGPHGGANRAVKVEPNINGGEGYTVTLYNLDGNHPVWQNNIQMAPKQMKIVNQTSDKIVLRGYGSDSMGNTFSDYGLSINLKNGSVEKCILHMHDRNIDIEYLGSGDQSPSNYLSSDPDLEEIKSFHHKWKRELSMNARTDIANKTDKLNDIGCKYYNNDDYENAILFFKKALEVMPINDDALKNLVICYKETKNLKKMKEAQIKLDFRNSL
jgi:hypothetical protein